MKPSDPFKQVLINFGMKYAYLDIFLNGFTVVLKKTIFWLFHFWGEIYHSIKKKIKFYPFFLGNPTYRFYHQNDGIWIKKHNKFHLIISLRWGGRWGEGAWKFWILFRKKLGVLFLSKGYPCIYFIYLIQRKTGCKNRARSVAAVRGGAGDILKKSTK